MKLALLLVVGAAAYPDSACTPSAGSPCENTFSGPGTAWEVASAWSEGHTPAAFAGWETVVSKSVTFDTVTGPAHTLHSENPRMPPAVAVLVVVVVVVVVVVLLLLLLPVTC